jgi:hypothetical protein
VTRLWFGARGDDSGARKHRFDGRGHKSGRIGSSHSGDLNPPLTSGTPQNHTYPANIDIGVPLPCTGSAPTKAPPVVPN